MVFGELVEELQVAHVDAKKVHEFQEPGFSGFECRCISLVVKEMEKLQKL